MAKPTAKEVKEVTDWFMTKFWPTYPAKYCGRGKGSRAIACKLMVAINPDESERERILGNLRAQVRSAAGDQNRSYWKIGETYVRNQLWNDEIESVMDTKERALLKICSIEGCRDDVHGERFIYCAKHIPNAHDKHLRESWTRTGIDRKSPTLGKDCQSYCRERFNILLSRAEEIK
jgi:hypothetical protein